MPPHNILYSECPGYHSTAAANVTSAAAVE